MFRFGGYKICHSEIGGCHRVRECLLIIEVMLYSVSILKDLTGT